MLLQLWLSFLFDSFVKIWATCEMSLGKWFTAPPGKKFPVRLCAHVCEPNNITVQYIILLWLTGKTWLRNLAAGEDFGEKLSHPGKQSGIPRE